MFASVVRKRWNGVESCNKNDEGNKWPHFFSSEMSTWVLKCCLKFIKVLLLLYRSLVHGRNPKRIDNFMEQSVYSALISVWKTCFYEIIFYGEYITIKNSVITLTRKLFMRLRHHFIIWRYHTIFKCIWNFFFVKKIKINRYV